MCVCRERKRTPTPPPVLKKEEEKVKEEIVEEVDPKKEPLSLEELLAKKQAEEAARSKVSQMNQPSLWSRDNIVASDLAGPGSNPGRVSFPG